MMLPWVILCIYARIRRFPNNLSRSMRTSGDHTIFDCRNFWSTSVIRFRVWKRRTKSRCCWVCSNLLSDWRKNRKSDRRILIANWNSMRSEKIIELASIYLAELPGHEFDVLEVAKPVSPDAALNLVKIISNYLGLTNRRASAMRKSISINGVGPISCHTT